MTWNQLFFYYTFPGNIVPDGPPAYPPMIDWAKCVSNASLAKTGFLSDVGTFTYSTPAGTPDRTPVVVDVEILQDVSELTISFRSTAVASRGNLKLFPHWGGSDV